MTAVDKHLEIAGKLVDPDATVGQRLAALPRIAAFHPLWYPTRWLRWRRWPFRWDRAPIVGLRWITHSTRQMATSVAFLSPCFATLIATFLSNREPLLVPFAYKLGGVVLGTLLAQKYGMDQGGEHVCLWRIR